MAQISHFLPGTSMYSAAAFTGAGLTIESQINAMIAACAADGVPIGWIPAKNNRGTPMYPFDSTLITYNSAVQLVREGGLGAEVFDVTAYGADPAGVADSTTAIQSCVDAAQATRIIVGGDIAVKPIVFPGRFLVGTGGTGLTARSSPWIGYGSSVGSALVWNAIGGSMVTKSTDAGQTSFWRCEHIDFVRAGSNLPATYIDLTAAGSNLDAQFFIHHCRFANTSGDCIKADAWTNAFFDHLRFDNIAGFAISLAPGASQNLSSFSLENFTWANGAGTNIGKGVLLIDASVHSNATNVGVVRVANARMEVNSAMTGNKGMIEIKSSSTSNSNWVGLDLQNLTLDDQIGASFLVYSSGGRFKPTGAVASTPAILTLNNIRTNGVSAVLGGDWNSDQIGTVSSNTASAVAFFGPAALAANKFHDLTYGTTINIDMSQGNFCRINVTDTVAFTIAKPTNMFDGTPLFLVIRNGSGGVMGAITWNAAFSIRETFTNPANGKNRSLLFVYSKSLDLFYQIGAQSADM